MSKELVQAMKALEEEKDISSSVIKEALETALVLAYKKNYDEASNVEVNFDEQTGEINVYSVKEVVEECTNPTLEISLADAHAINQAYEVGDQIKSEVTPADFGRIATQTAKHVIMQRIREAEREIIYNEYSQYEDEIMVGTVERQDQRFVFVNLDVPKPSCRSTSRFQRKNLKWMNASRCMSSALRNRPVAHKSLLAVPMSIS